MGYGLRHVKYNPEIAALKCRCGHTKRDHENPDTCCMVDGCRCNTFQYKE